MTRSINLIARTNGVGLDRDVDLIAEVAKKARYEVTISHCRSISPLSRWLPQKKTHTINIFLERFFPRWLGKADLNILVPNQERFPQRHLPHLKRIDQIFCKSTHALEIFRKHHPACQFIGFTSHDLFDPTIPRKEKGVLHLAGRSTLKGTETIVRLWKKHPEWPTLTLVQCQDNAPTELPQNIILRSHYLSDKEIRRISNENPVHLCTSRSEGWGHYLVEGMSCEALAITTDAPPMNELVQPERGFLVPFSRSQERHLGTNFFVDEDALESAIQRALETPLTDLRGYGKKARAWTQENHQEFKRRLTTALDALSPS